MLPVLDAQVRLVLLHHVAVRLAQAPIGELRTMGIDADQRERLRQLSPVDLHRLAGMRDLSIGIELDGERLRAGLRAVAVANKARSLEDYFIRHGASARMMSALFKVRRKVTLQRRRDCGVWLPPGRVRLPDDRTRESIYRIWSGNEAAAPRDRYYRLHQTFPRLSMAVLEAVVRAYEADR